jgi:hypothetical protein
MMRFWLKMDLCKGLLRERMGVRKCYKKNPPQSKAGFRLRHDTT